MTCYTRHLGDLLPANAAGGEKRALDAAIRRVLGLRGADCPELWASVKARREDPEFASRVRAELGVAD